MKFKCCRYLLSGLAFFPDRVKCCNQVKIGPQLVSDLKNLSKKQIESAREKIINDCKNGIYPECCADCEHFRKDDWEYSGKISFLAFFHWLHCNCGCIYCFNQFDTKNEFTDEVLPPIYPVANLIKEYEFENTDVEFGGGEPALLGELPQLSDNILKSDIKSCYIMTSGVKYSKDIARLLQNEKTFMSVTVSAGNAKTFARIKRRNRFVSVKNNIKKYLACAKDKNQVVVRYLIVDGVNDTEQDILDWLLMLKELNVVQNELTIEFCLAVNFKKGKKLSPKLYELADFYQKTAQQFGLSPRVDIVASKILERGYY